MLRKYKKTLITYFRDLNTLSRNPANIELCFSIQERLLESIRKIERRIQKTKQQIRALGIHLKTGRPHREESAKLKTAISTLFLKKEAYSQLLSILHDVGDGIAFIYLDKWNIKPLCMSKESAGFISGKKGLRLELKLFRECKARGTVCILNDLTNSLRHGDITIPKYGMPMIIEAKSGHSSSHNERAHRQIERTNKILNYIFKDKGESIYPEQGTQEMLRRSLSSRERHHRKKITNLLKTVHSSRKNILVTIEPGLFYLAGSSGKNLIKKLNRIPRSAKISLTFVNMEKHNNKAYLPFTLSLQDPESLFAFYAGECFIMVLIDLQLIEQELAKLGFVATFNDDGEFFIHLEKAQTKTKAAKISKHFWGRISAEFLNLKWITQEMCYAVAKPFKENEASIPENSLA